MACAFQYGESAQFLMAEVNESALTVTVRRGGPFKFETWLQMHCRSVFVDAKPGLGQFAQESI